MMTFRVALALIALAGPGFAGETKTPPNIVFLFADDWGRYASCYGPLDQRDTPNRVIHTPNIDAVAARGVLFRNAFVPAPSCTPCRSSLLSGRYFFNTGRAAILNGAIWDEAIPSFPLLLRDHGYQIGKTAKVWSPGTPADAPIGKQQYAFQKSGMQFNQFSQRVTELVGQGKLIADAKETLYAQVRGNFNAFRETIDPKKPFFYWFGPTNVHRSWVKGSGKKLWKIDPQELTGKLPQFLPDVPEVREDFADYLGEVMAFDACVGVILKELEDANLLANTLIVISGDHGAPGFPGGKCNLYDFGTAVSLVAAGPKIPGKRVVDDFINLRDLTPTFLEAAGCPLPDKLDGTSFWNVLTSDKQGLVDPQRTWVVTGRERHVGEAREGNKPYPMRAIRTKDFLYVRNFAPERWPMGDPLGVTVDKTPALRELENNTHVTFADMDAGPTKAWLITNRSDEKYRWHYQYAFGKRPAEELYDLKTDPDQVKNLADDPRYAEQKKTAAAALIAELTRAGDPRIVDKECRFEKPPFTDPYPRKK
jgi:arylsulfatase A-like enzyme